MNARQKYVRNDWSQLKNGGWTTGPEKCVCVGVGFQIKFSSMNNNQIAYCCFQLKKLQLANANLNCTGLVWLLLEIGCVQS